MFSLPLPSVDIWTFFLIIRYVAFDFIIAKNNRLHALMLLDACSEIVWQISKNHLVVSRLYTFMIFRDWETLSHFLLSFFLFFPFIFLFFCFLGFIFHHHIVLFLCSPPLNQYPSSLFYIFITALQMIPFTFPFKLNESQSPIIWEIYAPCYLCCVDTRSIIWVYIYAVIGIYKTWFYSSKYTIFSSFFEYIDHHTYTNTSYAMWLISSWYFLLRCFCLFWLCLEWIFSIAKGIS